MSLDADRSRGLAQFAISLLNILVMIRCWNEFLGLRGFIQVSQLFAGIYFHASLLHTMNLSFIEGARRVISAHVRLFLLFWLLVASFGGAETIAVKLCDQCSWLRQFFAILWLVFWAWGLLALEFGVGRQLTPLGRTLRQIADPGLNVRELRMMRTDRWHRLLLLFFDYLVGDQ